MNTLNEQVVQILTQEPQTLPADIATKLNVSELEVLQAFPSQSAVVISGDHARDLLHEIAGWKTDVTVIVQSGGSIFEVKAPLPEGKFARGYYNLMGQTGQLHGHLNLDNIAHIALVSKPFMGKESHYFGFLDAQGDNIFKIYLGRDAQRNLLPGQVETFQALKHSFVSEPDQSY
ncbi:ChuX-like family protein [Vibrio aerogenes CECT 7868]|uniref:ChuX-like family protein n=1 Tax=Vibrio aerogenes CECT 7868 TaxID=1216006 RepID=A0A1M5ZSM0_9VIBR|nr:heme utilization cystosolic carrier protein HutX [Vibrio aerogenes]SHI27158.1 ChuX-like family protein [Vibrio aerogenes CECT 7868]